MDEREDIIGNYAGDELRGLRSTLHQPSKERSSTQKETPSQVIANETGEDHKPVDAVPAREELRLRYSDTRVELDILRDRLERIKEDVAEIAHARMEWADASAHAQLGDYPWAKLAAAMAASFVATKALRALPMAAAGSAVLPLIISAVQRKGRQR
jgi:hypothetical protein